MSIKNCIMSLFYGSCDIFEAAYSVDENGVTRQKFVPKYRAVECRVIFQGRGNYAQHRNAATHEHKADLTSGLSVFLPIEYEVKEGSRLKVRQNDREYYFKCTSMPDRYTYHQQVKVIPYREEY